MVKPRPRTVSRIITADEAIKLTLDFRKNVEEEESRRKDAAIEEFYVDVCEMIRNAATRGESSVMIRESLFPMRIFPQVVYDRLTGPNRVIDDNRKYFTIEFIEGNDEDQKCPYWVISWPVPGKKEK